MDLLDTRKVEPGDVKAQARMFEWLGWDADSGSAVRSGMVLNHVGRILRAKTDIEMPPLRAGVDLAMFYFNVLHKNFWEKGMEGPLRLDKDEYGSVIVVEH